MDPVLGLLRTAYRLKDEERRGWVLRGVSAPESVADHSWGTALLCMLFAEAEGVDEAEALRISLVHDLAEAETGDIATRADPDAPQVDPTQKAEAERQAMDEMLFPVGNDPTAGRLRRLWEQYEARGTPEARFVRDMNLVDMCMQALVYEADRRYEAEAENEHFPSYRRLDEFFATSAPRLSTATGRRLFRAVHDAYLSLRSR
jgi:putative hydrolase of HD superfamily